MFSGASAKLDQVTPGVQSLTKEQLRELEHKLVDPEDEEKGEEDSEDDEYDSEDEIDVEDEGSGHHRRRKPLDPALHEVFTHLSDLADTVSDQLFSSGFSCSPTSFTLCLCVSSGATG